MRNLYLGVAHVMAIDGFSKKDCQQFHPANKTMSRFMKRFTGKPALIHQEPYHNFSG